MGEQPCHVYYRRGMVGKREFIMSNQGFVAGTIAWCDFSTNEKKISKKIKSKIITDLKKEESLELENSKIIEKINEIFASDELVKLAERQLKPEMWKTRPVLVIHSHETMKSVIALPLTTLEPNSKDAENFIFLPKQAKPETLRGENSWIMCNMPYHVSIKRLRRVKKGKKRVDAMIDREIYKEVIQRYKATIADDITPL